MGDPPPDAETAEPVVVADTVVPQRTLPQAEHALAQILEVAQRLAAAAEADGLPAKSSSECAGILGEAVDELRQAFARAAAAARSGRPTHFVGIRMPTHLQSRLAHLQAALAEGRPAVKAAAVASAKTHVTLLVTRVEEGGMAAAERALEEAAEQWRAGGCDGARPLQCSLRGLGHFERNGVLFAELGPVELLRELRRHVVAAFARAGMAVMDDKDVEDGVAEGSREVGGTGAGEAGDGVEAEEGDEAEEAEEEEEEGKGQGQGAAEEGDAAYAPEEGTATGEGGGQPERQGAFAPHVTLFKASQAGRGRGKRQGTKPAKQAVVRLGKALGPAAADLDVGEAEILVMELVDMKHTQADGYYQVLATAALGQPQSAVSLKDAETSKNPDEPVEAAAEDIDEAFAAAVKALVPSKGNPAGEAGDAASEKPAGKKGKKKKLKLKRSQGDAQEDEEEDEGQGAGEEQPAPLGRPVRRASSLAKTGSRRVWRPKVTYY